MTDSSAKEFTAEKNTIWIIYILHVLGFFTGGLTSVLAIVINHIKLSDMKSPVSVSHFQWQIRTFWWGLLWSLISLVLVFIFFFVGLLSFVIVSFWFVYRLVRGMMSLHNDKGMYGIA